MRIRGAGRGWKTLSRFALIGVIGGGAAACSSDASRLGDPFSNPFSSLSGEPSATGSLPENDDMKPAPAIRTSRVDSEALGAPGQAMSPRPVASRPGPTQTTRIASAEASPGAVAGMNPDAGRAMTPRAAPVAPQPKLGFSQGPKGVEKAVDKAAAAKEAARKAEEARKLAEAEARKAEAKRLAEMEAAKHHARPAQIAKADDKSKATVKDTAKDAARAQAKVELKPDPKAVAAKEAARKAEAEAKLAKAEAAKEVAKEAAKKVAEAKAAEAAAKAASVRETKQAAKEPVKETAPVKVASADPVSTGSVAAPASASESFRWPAKGRVINGYGSSGNEGINIAVPEGTPVKAAEDGTVAYAGSDVKGYGKLVLVRHTNGYVSAYAHNGELDVRPGEKVKRGQTIAKSGATGNVTSPQLHFEIRKGATPVDPMPHLASN